MFKPKIYSSWANPDLGCYSKNISVSIDMVNKHEADFKIFLQMEPNTISKCKNQVISSHSFYNLILCWDQDLLKLPNSKLFPFGTCRIKDTNVDVNYKKPKISFLTSNKNFCSGHKLRHKIYNYLPEHVNNFNISKHMSPPIIKNKEEMLSDFQYSIIVENEKQKNWFTEKLIDCFACKTVPIYYGCPNVSSFFNEKGIITFDTIEDLKHILKNITLKNYYDIIDSVNDNFSSSLEYYDIWERLIMELKQI